MEQNKKPSADIRYLLANERTLLAWLRTAIALVAGGLVVSHFSSNHLLQKLLSVLIIALGGLVAVIGYLRFRATEQAIHDKKHLNGNSKIQSTGLALISMAFIAAILYSIR